MKYVIRSNEQGTLFWLKTRDKNNYLAYSWTKDKNDELILKFDTETEAVFCLSELGFPTQKGKHIYYSYVEKFNEKNNANYIMVRDSNGKMRQMTLDIFSGMLFCHCFDVIRYQQTYRRRIFNYTQTREMLIKYPNDKNINFSVTLTRRFNTINQDCHVVDILDGSDVIYRIQFNHMTPVLIENHINNKFIRGVF